ncbi:hypothetical protein BDF22DRAFT_667449 [Syncephalis plumigaleata]|nr:hypothetical protein BDF22DRAFT_667449 [Syncephalis plumigaleata]
MVNRKSLLRPWSMLTRAYPLSLGWLLLVLLLLTMYPQQVMAADSFNFTILPFAVAGICSKDNLNHIAYETRTTSPGASAVWIMDRMNFDNITKPRTLGRVNSTYTPQPANYFPAISCVNTDNTTIPVCRRDSGEGNIEFSSRDHRLCIVVVNRLSRHSLNVTINTDFTIDHVLATSSANRHHHYRVGLWPATLIQAITLNYYQIDESSQHSLSTGLFLLGLSWIAIVLVINHVSIITNMHPFCY